MKIFDGRNPLGQAKIGVSPFGLLHRGIPGGMTAQGRV